ncbi:PREDICTED: thrombomodulin-like [Cyprinodon variegatus]|uniref:thrombomodulin-like n=1 Tax=Cyprinodon variegatus TaxID=28743 RepID=UPI0007429ECE|nr:PREDICTED: thrombomodulin-like [Cyprinodon variegatus]
MAALLSALLFVAMEAGLGLKQACLPVCSGDDCITVNRARLDFDSAEEVCRRKNGELLTLQTDTYQRIFKTLAEALPGNFWIGLRLSGGSCSNLSEPLRGYKWTSGSEKKTLNWSAVIWADERNVCPPYCVSVSQHGTWTERACSVKADGFLCRTREKNFCWEKEVFFKDSQGCIKGPCEQKCNDTEGGFKCSCFTGYIPDSSDPRRCRVHCPEQRCPSVCPEGCHCPDGFVKNEEMCEDINECENNGCHHGCVNTFGSFWCYCRPGFHLKENGNCYKAKSHHPAELMTPTHKNTTLKGSSAPAGPFLWIWVVAAVTLVATVVLVRLYVVRRQKRRERSSSQQPAAAADHQVH